MSRRGFSMLQSEAEKQRKIGDGTLLQFAFVQIEEMREIATGRSGAGEGAWVDILQTKFGERFGEGASEAGCLSDGGEIRQMLCGRGGVNDARGEGFNAEAGDGSECKSTHGLSGKVAGELGESESVNALTARLKSTGGEFIGGGSSGRDDENVRVRGRIGEEGSGVAQECGVGAGVNERTGGHK